MLRFQRFHILFRIFIMASPLPALLKSKELLGSTIGLLNKLRSVSSTFCSQSPIWNLIFKVFFNEQEHPEYHGTFTRFSPQNSKKTSQQLVEKLVAYELKRNPRSHQYLFNTSLVFSFMYLLIIFN